MIRTVRFRPSLRTRVGGFGRTTVYICPLDHIQSERRGRGRAMSRVFRGCRTLGGIMSKLYHGDKYWNQVFPYNCDLSLSGAGYVAYGIGKAA
ncbi:hypothetical protein C4D60_Mb01t11380 [Musa balbisiana]|uniref:Uncharacterized protein n=1 Tax=Musa balbisiana TaxID=52838 RepID=A0A4S8JLF8_MUSBA|nr:hypothetical protein C4D60_Mb01t11380 [Musa balbisiana]